MLRNKVWRGQTGLKILHPFLSPYPTDWQERNQKCDAFHLKTTPICWSLMVAFDWTTAVCFHLANKSGANNIQWNFGISKIRVDILYHMPRYWFGYRLFTLCVLCRFPSYRRRIDPRKLLSSRAGAEDSVWRRLQEGVPWWRRHGLIETQWLKLL